MPQKMGVIDISYGQVKQTHWLKAGWPPIVTEKWKQKSGDKKTTKKQGELWKSIRVGIKFKI
jgi:hypothetical protein